MNRAKNKEKNILDGSGLKIGIVVSLFNDDITMKMLDGALSCLAENKVKKENIKIVFAPGAFEIPLFCQKLAKTKKYDALVALGCVIKGDTDHYYYIAGEASRGVMEVGLKYDIPIGFGIITVNNLKQASERAGAENNKGREATIATLMSVKAFQK